MDYNNSASSQIIPPADLDKVMNYKLYLHTILILRNLNVLDGVLANIRS